jgi:hypothetical protein
LKQAQEDFLELQKQQPSGDKSQHLEFLKKRRQNFIAKRDELKDFEPLIKRQAEIETRLEGLAAELLRLQ